LRFARRFTSVVDPPAPVPAQSGKIGPLLEDRPLLVCRQRGRFVVFPRMGFRKRSNGWFVCVCEIMNQFRKQSAGFVSWLSTPV